MGLSRNKVAVSEGAAGSPPFYGEHDTFSRAYRIRGRVKTEDESVQHRLYGPIVVQFSVTDEKVNTRYGGVAQLGEHLPCKQGVMGSIPIISTRQRDGDEATITTMAHSSGG